MASPIRHFKMNVSEEDMTPVAPQKKQNQELQRFVLQKAVMLAQLDLRGKRYEEALAEVDQYIDRDSSGLSTSNHCSRQRNRCIKNRNNGIFKNHRSVKSYEFAPQNQGGNGATVVKFQ